MLHVLPSTVKKEASEDADAPGSSSYKKKKESKDKANSSRSVPASGPGFPALVPPLPAPWAPSSCGGLSPSSVALLRLFPHLQDGEDQWCLTLVVV